MAEPMIKNDVRSRLARRHPNAPMPDAKIIARAEELERKLGRPLRPVIEGPLSDAESEEQLLARMTDGCEMIPAEKFLEDFKRFREKRAK